eukprot:CAMPEP_0197721714 /NCGR_PEP_ID=MMETSP1434-20131217/4679_1 /TAXON_ID=265543 /ORGANISM="Minutocellus polymorphus, Strain CCMP3303" /LENGTH=142 /DNA_ID=CAMNT_0043306771 /DNA_START=306 /DNA_END=731 /DNA_ORIENTATION=-
MQCMYALSLPLLISIFLHFPLNLPTRTITTQKHNLRHPSISIAIAIAIPIHRPSSAPQSPYPPVVLPPVLVVEAAGLGVGGTGGVGIAQQALDAGQNGRDVVDRAPLVLEDVEADLAVVVDVGVEHFGEEADVRGLVGVVLG